MKNKPWTVINSLFHIASSAESLLGGNKKGAEYIASRYYDNIKYFLGLQVVQIKWIQWTHLLLSKENNGGHAMRDFYGFEKLGNSI